MDRDSCAVQTTEVASWSTSRKRDSGVLEDNHEFEAHLRRLFELLPGMIRAASPERQLEYVSHRLWEVIGVSLAEVVGTSSDRDCHPGDAQRSPTEPLRQGTEGLLFKYGLMALNSYVTNRLSPRVCDDRSRQNRDWIGLRSNERLSARECAVLALIARGQSNKRVAQALRITPETVKSHIKRAFVKLGSKTRAEAVARATELGFLGTAATLPVSSHAGTASVRAPRTPAQTHAAHIQRSSAREQGLPSLVGAL